MFSYQKTLQYPVRIKNTNPKLAAQIITQYGGPDGELGASLRYLSQRYAMPYPEIQGLLTDIGCEELRHTSYIRKKPLFSRGLSVCRHLFNSFSKLKIDENYKEKRRLFY